MTVVGTWCTQAELSSEVPAPRPPHHGYVRARVLARLHGLPIGFLHVDLARFPLRPADLLAHLDEASRRRAEAHLAAEGQGVAASSGVLPQPARGCSQHVEASVDVTVVVCTRGRPVELAGCLRALRRLTYPRLAVLVVDNAPSDDRTLRAFEGEVGEDARFAYVVEPLPGLSRARNRGLVEARTEVVAYTDDDVSVDPAWVEGLVRGLTRRSDVGCVTGLVCTAAVDGPAEAYFDARVSWAGSCDPALFDLTSGRTCGALFPYSPGLFGTGANMAFRRDALLQVGGFDTALGAGTRTGGGEDVDAFVRVLQAGWALAYEPSALVWHHHRGSMDALHRQMFAYGTGLSAFLAKHLADPRTRPQVLRRVAAGIARARHIRAATDAEVPPTVETRAAQLREAAGVLAGPALYLLARRTARRLDAHAPRRS